MKDERRIEGHLESVDKFMNLKMAGCQVFTEGDQSYHDQFLVRGNYVKSIEFAQMELTDKARGSSRKKTKGEYKRVKREANG